MAADDVDGGLRLGLLCRDPTGKVCLPPGFWGNTIEVKASEDLGAMGEPWMPSYSAFLLCARALVHGEEGPLVDAGVRCRISLG